MLKDIHIQNYRGIKDLHIKDFKRINLLVGDNNSGKTSILEAVTYIANHTIVPFFNFENVREIGMFADLSKINLQEQKIWDNLEHLVYEKNIKEGFVIDGKFCSESSLERSVKLEASFSNQAENFSTAQLLNSDRVIINQNQINSFIASYTTSEKTSTKLGFSRNGKYNEASNSSFSIPIAIVPSDTTKSYDLVPPMERVAKENGEIFFSNLAQKIDPKIKAIKTAGSQILADIGKISIPLKYMGDGLISVLNILLKTREVKNGILLIDEIENGLHWKTQKVLWKALLMATKENNIQIIATTHSLDTIKYLSEAYEEYLNEASKEEKNLLGEDEARVFSLYKKDKSFVEKIDSQSLKTMITHHYEIR